MSYVLQMCVPSYERNRVMVIILSITFYTRSLLPLIFLTSPTTAHRTINTPPSTSNLHKTKRPLSTFPHSFTLGPLNFSLSFSHIMLTHSYLISTHDLPVLNLSLSYLHNPLRIHLSSHLSFRGFKKHSGDEFKTCRSIGTTMKTQIISHRRRVAGGA